MFSISIRITKRQIAAAGAVLVLAFAGGLWAKAALAELRGSPAQSGAVEKKVQQPAVKIEKMPGKTSEQRLDFLASFGWEVENEEAEILEVMIPKDFDEVIARYNEVQKTQGCDLEKYAGKRCKRYSYNVINYPDKSENIRANLIVYNGKIIGGDICSLEMDGFIHGFMPPED